MKREGVLDPLHSHQYPPSRRINRDPPVRDLERRGEMRQQHEATPGACRDRHRQSPRGRGIRHEETLEGDLALEVLRQRAEPSEVTIELEVQPDQSVAERVEEGLHVLMSVERDGNVV